MCSTSFGSIFTAVLSGFSGIKGLLFATSTCGASTSGPPTGSSLCFGRQLCASHGDHSIARGKRSFSLIVGVRLIGEPAGKAIGIPCGDIVLIQQSELLSQRIIKVKRRGELKKRMTEDIPLFESAVMDGLQALFADLLTLEADLGVKRATKSMPCIFEVIFCLEQPPKSLCPGFLQSPPPSRQYPSENSDQVLPRAVEILARNR